MSYVVNWRGVDGSPGWHTVADLTDAAAHVEHLRNTEGVDGAKIYRLEEVAFELKPYFRVEIAAPSVFVEPPAKPVHADESWADATWVDAAPAVADAEVELEATAAVEAPVLESAGDSAANGATRRGLFGR